MRYFSTSVEAFENTSKETPSFVLIRIAGTGSETFSVSTAVFSSDGIGSSIKFDCSVCI